MQLSKSFAPFRAWVLGADGSAGVYNAPGLPSITGDFGEGYNDATNMPATGAFDRKGVSGLRISGSDVYSNVGRYTFNASKSNDIYGKSTTVMPPSVNFPMILYLGRPK